MAYVLHGEIVLSPDDIWLAIAMSFSDYVNENHQELRNLLVDHETGTREIII